MRDRRVVAVVVVLLVVAAIVPIYLIETSPKSQSCYAPPGIPSNFTSTSLKPNGSIVMVLSTPSPVTVQSIASNGSAIAMAVVDWPFASIGPNASLQQYATQLQSDGIAVLGDVPHGAGSLTDVSDYASSGLNGIYVSETGASGGPCSVSEITSMVHDLGGFVAVGAPPGSAAQGPLPDTNLMVLTYAQSAWNPGRIQSLIPYAATTAVVIENASAQVTLFLLDSLHAIHVRYFLVSEASNGTDLVPVQNQGMAYDQLYLAHWILPADWIASFTGTEEVDQASANGTIYFLLNQTLGSPGPALTMDEEILAVNLSFGDPLFETPSVSIPVNSTDWTGLSQTVTVGGGVVYFVVILIHSDPASNVEASNMSWVTVGFNSSTGALVSQSQHSLLVVPSQYTGFPTVFCTAYGPTVMASIMLFDPPGYLGLWVTTVDALTGDVLGAHQITLFAGNSISPLVVGAVESKPSALGPYFELSGTYTLENSTSEWFVPYLVLIDSAANVTFQDSATPQLNLDDGEISYLSRNTSTTYLDSYDLTDQHANSPIPLGDVPNLTGSIVLVDGLTIVESWNGSCLAFTGSGQLSWEVRVPVTTENLPFTPLVLPGARLLVGASIEDFSVAVSHYSQEFWVLNATTGGAIAYYNQSFLVLPVGNPPGLPNPLPASYQPITVIGAEFEFTSWDDGGDYFVNVTAPSSEL